MSDERTSSMKLPAANKRAHEEALCLPCWERFLCMARDYGLAKEEDRVG